MSQRSIRRAAAELLGARLAPTLTLTLALILAACGGAGAGGGGGGDWYYHFVCNGDSECLTTNSIGQTSGTIDVGPVESDCTSLLLFASKFWGPDAWNGCDHSPTFTPPGAGAITVTGLSATAGIPGTPITISGTGFPLGGAGITLDVGGVAIPVTSLTSTATTITFTVPVVGSRSGPITVHAPGGQATTSASFTILDDLAAVAWGSGRFVAVGAYGTALTSGDGVQWTPRSTGVNPGVVSLASVAWTGSGFLAGGSNGYLLSSPDGAAWTLPASGLGMVTFNGIATSDQQIVAVASGGLTATSASGAAWVTQNNPADLFNAVVWTGTQYVMTGYAILTSPDGTTWTTRVPQATPYYGVAWSGATLAAVGSGGAVLTSPDGVTWTPRSSGTGSSLRAVTWFNGRFVAVGDGGTVVTSPDGVTWTVGSSGVSGALAGVAASTTTAVAVGKAGLTIWSSDGLDWTSQLPPPPTNVAGTHEVGQSTVTWTASPGATSYVVYASTLGTVSRSSYQRRVTSGTTSAQLTGLSGSGWWYVVVAGVNEHGEGAPSAVASVCVGLYICSGG
jgi:IPT/TIG domain